MVSDKVALMPSGDCTTTCALTVFTHFSAARLCSSLTSTTRATLAVIMIGVNIHFDIRCCSENVESYSISPRITRRYIELPQSHRTHLPSSPPTGGSDITLRCASWETKMHCGRR